MLSKLIQFIKTHQADLVLTIAVILISVISFNLGRISSFKSQKTPITVTEPSDSLVVGVAQDKKSVPKSIQHGDLTVAASKKSSAKVYHFSWCPGASKIAAKNKVTFPNEAAAITAGYTLASNCSR